MNPRLSYSMALAAHDISDAMDDLLGRPSEKVEWLIRVAEQASLETNKTERAEEGER